MDDYNIETLNQIETRRRAMISNYPRKFASSNAQVLASGSRLSLLHYARSLSKEEKKRRPELG